MKRISRGNSQHTHTSNPTQANNTNTFYEIVHVNVEKSKREQNLKVIREEKTTKRHKHMNKLMINNFNTDQNSYEQEKQIILSSSSVFSHTQPTTHPPQINKQTNTLSKNKMMRKFRNFPRFFFYQLIDFSFSLLLIILLLHLLRYLMV